MKSVEEAKRDLLAYARQHDAEKAERRKPWRAALIAAGAVVVATRVLGAAGRRRGGLLRGLVALRLLTVYGPTLVRAFRVANTAYQRAKADNGRYKPPSRTRRLPEVTPVRREHVSQTY